MNTSPYNQQKRIVWVDLVKITSILLVIGIHAVDEVVYGLWGKAPFRHDVNLSWWLTGIVYKSLTSMCVPILFMLSGYLMLSPTHNDLFVFFRKRFTKILIPLFAWSVIYLWWDGSLAQTAPTAGWIKLVIKSVLTNQAYFHLWFLYVLVGLYLVTPLFASLIENIPDIVAAYIIALWLVSIVVFPLFHFLSGYDLALFAQPYVSGYFGYYLAGYFLGKKEYSIKTALGVAILLTLFIVGKTFRAYFLTIDGGKFDTDLFEYLNWHVVIPSLAGFIILKYLAQILEKKLSVSQEKLVISISNATFGIYLVHIIILQQMHDGILGLQLSTASFHPLLATPVTVLVAFMISLLTVRILQKIPLLSKIVP